MWNRAVSTKHTFFLGIVVSMMLILVLGGAAAQHAQAKEEEYSFHLSSDGFSMTFQTTYTDLIGISTHLVVPEHTEIERISTDQKHLIMQKTRNDHTAIIGISSKNYETLPRIPFRIYFSESLKKQPHISKLRLFHYENGTITTEDIEGLNTIVPLWQLLLVVSVGCLGVLMLLYPLYRRKVKVLIGSLFQRLKENVIFKSL